VFNRVLLKSFHPHDIITNHRIKDIWKIDCKFLNVLIKCVMLPMLIRKIIQDEDECGKLLQEVTDVFI